MESHYELDLSKQKKKKQFSLSKQWKHQWMLIGFPENIENIESWERKKKKKKFASHGNELKLVNIFEKKITKKINKL